MPAIFQHHRSHHRFTLAMVMCIIFAPFDLMAKTAPNSPIEGLSSSLISDPFYLLFVLIAISLLPFFAIMVTSFTKIVVVLSIARQAIGTAQTPPSIVLMGMAIMLTAFSMYPVGMEIYDRLNQSSFKSAKGIEALKELLNSGKEPLKKYLQRHAKEEDKKLFLGLIAKHENISATISADDLVILAPAFLISELTLAFQIGFLIYLPFLVIDMTVANLLMALGMQMLAPTTISLPFKILLFVLVDGWRMLAEGLAKV